MSGTLHPVDGDPFAPPLQGDPSRGLAAYNPGGGPDAQARFDDGQGRLNPAQTAFARAYQKAGNYDPHAPVGSMQHFVAMAPNSPNPLAYPEKYPVGTWVLDYDGQLKQVTDDVRDPGHAGQHVLSAPAQLTPAGHDPFQNGPPVGWVEDAVRSAGTGLEKGAAGAIGGGGDLNNAWNSGLLSAYSHGLGAIQGLGDKAGLDLTSQAFPDQRPNAWERRWGTPVPTATMDGHGNLQNGWAGATAPDNLNFAHMNGQVTSRDVNSLEQGVFGPQWQPQTAAGRFAEGLTENLPAAALPGGAFARGMRVLTPSVGGWTAGELAHGTPYEPYARMAGTVLGGGVQGFGEGIGRRAETWLGDAIPNTITDDQLQQVAALRDRAQAMGQPLSLAEAMQWTTNGQTGLGRLQRLVENNRATQPAWAGFYADRPTAQANAVGNFLGGVAPPGASQQDLGTLADISPGMAGQRAQQAAKDALATADTTRRQAAQAAGYAAADPQDVNADLVNALVQSVRRRVASDPRGPASGTLNSFADDLIAQRAVPGSPATRVQGANGIWHTTPATPGSPEVPVTNIGDLSARENNWQSAIAGDPARMDTPSKFEAGALGPYLGNLRSLLQSNPDFAAGEAEFANQSANLVDPLHASPVGAIGGVGPSPGTSDLGTQLSHMFPQNPYPGASADTSRAIGALNAEDPLVSAILARKHIGGTFDQMTRELTSGPNQYGGARFRSAIMGNPEQSDTLAAALTGVDPSGATNQSWNALQNVLGATGMRERPGSLTAFNQADKDALSIAPLPIRSIGNLVDPLEWGVHLNKALGAHFYDRTTANLTRLLQSDAGDTADVLAAALANRSNPARTALPAAIPALLQLQNQPGQ